jgi:hypothetical protein
MSLILDALKRAERERRLERAPDLTAVYEEDHLPKRGIQPYLWLGGAFLIGAIVVGIIMWPDTPGPHRPPVPTKRSVTHSVPKTAAKKEGMHHSHASPESTVLKQAGGPPVQATPPQPSPAPVQTPQRQAVSPPAQGIPPASSVEKPIETAGQTRAPAVSGPAHETADKKAPVPEEKVSVVQTAAAIPTAEPAPKPSAAAATRSVTEGTPVQPPPPPSAPQAPSVEPASAKPPPAPPPAGPKVDAPPGKPGAIPLISELPFEVREKLGKLQINVHSYSENPAERLVFINMRSYKVGDRIGEDGPVLKEITPEGAIIDYGQGQARLLVWR